MDTLKAGKDGTMNLKPLLRRLADFLFNLTVARIAVSVFEGVWYGIIVGAFTLLLGVCLSIIEGGWDE